MPLTRFVADALGAVTICLVAVLILLGFFCILYSFYFRSRIRTQVFVQLGYFNGPWVIRISLILFSFLWGLGEIIRLSLLRRERRLLNAFDLEWQENICKYYVVSNLGFSEPCIFLALVLLLRASLQKTEAGALSRKWNFKTSGCVFLLCLPIFLLQLVIILVGRQNDSYVHKLPHYFTSTSIEAKMNDHDEVVSLCAYPLLSTIVLGFFATVLTAYLFWLGGRIINLVINKGLRRRVYILILSFSGLFPLRVILIGLSVLFKPETSTFEILAFLAFLSLLCCVGVGICVLVYFPISDALSLRNFEARGRSGDLNEFVSLISNLDLVEENTDITPGRNSGSSTKRGSISFRTTARDEESGAFVELSPFSPTQHLTPPGSPRVLGWPMLPPPTTTQVSGS